MEAIPPEFANDPDDLEDEEELPPVPPPPGHGDEEVESSSEDEGEDLDALTGQVTLPSGIVIDKASAAFVKTRRDDADSEDEYGYTIRKIHKKYKTKVQDGSELVYVNINRGTSGLGISLAGITLCKCLALIDLF